MDVSDSVFFLSSPVKLLGWLKLDYLWSSFRMGEWKFVHGIWVKWSRYLPCPYMVKTLWKNIFSGLESLFMGFESNDQDICHAHIWSKPYEKICSQGLKVCSWDLGQMIKIFVIPIYGQNPLKKYSQDLKGQRPWNLVCSIGDSGPTRFVQMVTFGWSWPILNMKSKQFISKFKYWKIELWKYKVRSEC